MTSLVVFWMGIPLNLPPSTLRRWGNDWKATNKANARIRPSESVTFNARHAEAETVGRNQHAALSCLGKSAADNEVCSRPRSLEMLEVADKSMLPPTRGRRGAR
jgi:hypothetical protein